MPWKTWKGLKNSAIKLSLIQTDFIYSYLGSPPLVGEWWAGTACAGCCTLWPLCLAAVRGPPPSFVDLRALARKEGGEGTHTITTIMRTTPTPKPTRKFLILHPIADFRPMIRTFLGHFHSMILRISYFLSISDHFSTVFQITFRPFRPFRHHFYQLLLIFWQFLDHATKILDHFSHRFMCISTMVIF